MNGPLHHLMANIWIKAISILAGNLNSGLSYLITTVTFPTINDFNRYNESNLVFGQNCKLHQKWARTTYATSYISFFMKAYYNIKPQRRMHSKSLWIKCAVSIFYETEFEIWAGFGLVGSIENCPTYTANMYSF